MDSTPKQWLSTVNGGPGVWTARGLAFWQNRFIPFLISGLLLFIISFSLIMAIVGGIMWITAGGNKEGMAKARNTVTYALIGLALGLGSFIILSILGSFLGQNLLGTIAPSSGDR